jgi:hypothetical protein
MIVISGEYIEPIDVYLRKVQCGLGERVHQ